MDVVLKKTHTERERAIKQFLLVVGIKHEFLMRILPCPEI